MASEANKQIALEIAHVLFIDIVGYSKLSTAEQRTAIDTLNEIVRTSEQFQKAEAAERLLKIPTGDGMALVFYTSPEASAYCAVEVSRALKNHSSLQVRMGMHSGSVSGVVDVSGRANLAGAGLNIAQRVMDCGDAGHILISKNSADDLREYEHWRGNLHDLGTCEVKHGVHLHMFNLVSEEVGNRAMPSRVRVQRRRASRRRWITVAGATALVAMGAVLLLYWRSPEIFRSGANSVAVLPFKPLLPENRDPVLEMGMADTLITQLSSSGEIVVPSLTSVRSYAGVEQDAVTAGRKLGVKTVLEGNVLKTGDRLRVTARLIKVADGTSLWSSTFNENFTDVFAVQDIISQKVAEALSVRLNAEEQKRLTKRHTDNVAAYQVYLTGRFHWNKFTPMDLRKSIDFFEQAIAIDPDYALAYLGLGDAYRGLAMTGEAPAMELFPKAKAALSKALQIDSSLAEARATLALVEIFFDWDWSAAEREARQAVVLDPNSGSAHLALAQVLCTVGRHPEALREAKRGRELDQVSLINNLRNGAFLYLARHYEEAAERLQRTLELDPNFWLAHLYLGKTRLEQNQNTEALAAFNKAVDSSRSNVEAIAMVGYFFGRTGDHAKARAALDQLKTLSTQRHVAPYHIALVHAGLGEQNEAIAWLEKAFAERDPRMSWLKVEPSWDTFRGNAHFVEIVKRLRLE